MAVTSNCRTFALLQSDRTVIQGKPKTRQLRESINGDFCPEEQPEQGNDL